MSRKGSPNESEKAKEKVFEDTLKDLLTDQLERLGTGGIFVWSIFLLCVLPNILNGFHVSSYTLLGHVPDDQWCGVSGLQNSTWTVEQQRSIAEKGLTTKGCYIHDWDYEFLGSMTFEDALNYTEYMSQISPPMEVSCRTKGTYKFKGGKSTFVTDWELVCDRALQRTSAQVFLSLGKFFGSFSFGIFADKFGRKTAFTLGSILFVMSSLLCTFSPCYNLFLVGRLGLGAASSGLFYPGFTMIVENVCLKHRSWMSIAFSASYPIGMVLLALAAYLVESWRYLQFTLTVPAFLLIINCYLLNESPRWLITKKRYNHAYKVLFKQKSPYEIDNTVTMAATDIDPSLDKRKVGESEVSLLVKLRQGPLKQFIELFASWKVRRMIFTSYFMFCVTSLSYYVTALNASNMSVSRYLYVAITGIVDIPSYLIPVVMLRYTGRRITTFSLFVLTGAALLIMLLVPSHSSTWVISFAMLGRFGISATYSVVTLYTAELYPTEIRNSALGTCSTWAHVGSISAPYVVDVLGLLGWYIPTTICGCCVLIAALLTLCLPETGSGKLSDRVEDVPSNTTGPSVSNSKPTENLTK